MTRLPMKPSARIVLQQLRDNKTVTTHDFLVAGAGSRFGARIGELRKLGFGIENERLPLPTRGDRYWLTHDAERGGSTLDPHAPTRPGTADTDVTVSLDAGLFDAGEFDQGPDSGYGVAA